MIMCMQWADVEKNGNFLQRHIIHVKKYSISLRLKIISSQSKRGGGGRNPVCGEKYSEKKIDFDNACSKIIFIFSA